MPVPNARVADLLGHIADLLEIRGGMVFQVRAYRRAAQTIDALGESVEKLATEGGLTDLPGIGEGIAKKIVEFVQTGGLRYLRELERDVPRGVADLLRVPGLGPKKAQRLHAELGVDGVAALRRACEQGQVRALEGFGETSERALLRAIAFLEKAGERILLSTALGEAEPLLAHVRGLPGVGAAEAAGSLRRMRETIGDIDVLVRAPRAAWAKVIDGFVAYPGVAEVLAQGETKSSVRLASHVQVDVRVVEPASWGAALLYFTGSKEHNIALRTLAQRKGFTVSEWGAFRAGSDIAVAGRTEEEVYRLLGLDWVPPELREDRGELDAAASGALPDVLAEKDLRGDLHVHTDASDGRDPLAAMVAAAHAAGRAWLGISDHTAGLAVTGGLDDARLRRQIDLVRRHAERGPLPLLVGVEANIGKGGDVDVPPMNAKDLDYVLASVHSHFTLPRKEQTARLLRALDDPRVAVLGHPTGRLLGQREPVDADWSAVYERAAERGVALELNAFPNRLDLNGEQAFAARAAGCTFAVDTDAHATEHVALARYGVAQARRGWLEAKHVVTAWPLAKARKALARGTA